MRVLVCGGRDYSDTLRVHRELDARARDITTVIQGGADGADKAAMDWARARGFDYLTFRAEWQKHGPKAGPMRNATMIHEGKPDLVLAFPGGRGTADMARRAKAAGIPLEIIQ